MTKDIIYGLADPRTKQLRYIGQTTQGLKARLKNHLYAARNGKGRQKVVTWIRSLLKEERLPEAFIIEAVSDRSMLEEAEQFYIAYFKSLGCDLTNHTKGGKTLAGWSKEEETKEKLRVAALKQWSDPTMRELLSTKHIGQPPGNKGIPHSEETRQKMKKAWEKRPRKHTRQWRENISRGHGGRPIKEINTSRVFASVAEAAEILNLHAPLISRQLRGLAKHTGGYSFVYLEGSSGS